MVMRPIGIALATASWAAIFGLHMQTSAAVDGGLTAPQPVNPDFIKATASKAACATVASVTEKMQADRRHVGGKIVEMTNGVDQQFADQWRRLTKLPPVHVKIVLAHGFGPASNALVET